MGENVDTSQALECRTGERLAALRRREVPLDVVNVGDGSEIARAAVITLAPPAWKR